MATALITVASFVAVSHPATYKATSKLLGSWIASSDGLPKMGGLVLHAVVFIFLVGLLMHLFSGRKSGFSPAEIDADVTDGVGPDAWFKQLGNKQMGPDTTARKPDRMF